MANHINRREFLKCLLAAAAVQGLGQPGRNAISRLSQAKQQSAQAHKPNIIVLVYDALAADHMSVYGYPRDTTPHLAQFAQRSTVYHHHFAGGNFTTTGTASLLTGTYPWSHRAFNIAAPVDRSYARRNLFSALVGAGYHRVAYTHNLLADFFLQQFQADLELRLPPETWFLFGTPALNQVFPADRDVVYRGMNFITRLLDSGTVLPGSLFLSLANEIGLEQYEATGDPELAALFPEGLPEEGYTKSYFTLETAIDGMTGLLKESPQPFLAYFHLYPPHHPYHPRAEFVGRFRDQWAPAGKPQHHFSEGLTDEDLNERRIKYDEYLAYADSEFGRFAAFLADAGLMENTWIVFTADHGEMFERGIKGHNAPVLYDPLVHIPLIVHQPGQTAREDIFNATSCVDVLPTLVQAAGLPLPDWGEGRPLPLRAGDPIDPARAIYAVDARQNAKYQALERGTVAMVKDMQKFIAYYRYRNFDRQYELYDIASDPREMKDLARLDSRAANQLKNELEITLNRVNLTFRA